MTKKQQDHLILCGGIRKKAGDNYKVHNLELGKGSDKIHLYCDSISQKMVQKVPPLLQDLLEIATYIYSGDQNVSRGGRAIFEYANDWHRNLYYEIPVREYDFWTNEEISRLLANTLSFMSGDTYRFSFHKLSGNEPDFLNLGSEPNIGFKPEAIVLFSGGLDSFTGVMEEILSNNTHITMVSHQSNSKMQKLQGELNQYILELTGKERKTFHIPVIINKGKKLTFETTQRSRSFLYATLGAVIAKMFGLRKVKFYENGITSCNLSFDGQGLQARSTRSTHPKVLNNLSELVSTVFNEDFMFENPFFTKTKTDVIERLKELQQQAKIELTRSCAKSIFRGNLTHCGLCSQCIERRFAVLACKCQNYDPDWQYAVDLFTGPRENIQDRAMIAGFTGFAIKTANITLEEFVRNHITELTEMKGGQEGITWEHELQNLYHLHNRHALQVTGVVESEWTRYGSNFTKGLFNDTCLLSMIGRKEHMHIEKIYEAEQPKRNIKRKAKRGRKPNPEIARRDRKMLEAWNTGHFRTFQELAREFDLPSDDAARQAITREKRRQNKK